SGSPPRPQLSRAAGERSHHPGLRGRENEQVQDSGAGGRSGERGVVTVRSDAGTRHISAQVSYALRITKRAAGEAARSVSEGMSYFVALVTFSAAGPFAPWTMSNSTRSPSARLRKPSIRMAE